MKGVIYAKTPMHCLDKMKELKGQPDEYIFLFGDSNSSEWTDRIAGQEIDCNKVYGVSIFDIQQLGGVIDVPEPFNVMEVLWVLNQINSHLATFKECLILLRGSYSTPIYLQFNRSKENIIQQVEEKLEIWKQKENSKK